jgi:hypothetical protein
MLLARIGCLSKALGLTVTAAAAAAATTATAGDISMAPGFARVGARLSLSAASPVLHQLAVGVQQRQAPGIPQAACCGPHITREGGSIHISQRRGRAARICTPRVAQLLLLRPACGLLLLCLRLPALFENLCITQGTMGLRAGGLHAVLGSSIRRTAQFDWLHVALRSRVGWQIHVTRQEAVY